MTARFELNARARILAYRDGKDAYWGPAPKRLFQSDMFIISIMEGSNFLHVEISDPKGNAYGYGNQWSLVFSSDPEFKDTVRPHLIPKALEELRKLQVLDDLAAI